MNPIPAPQNQPKVDPVNPVSSQPIKTSLPPNPPPSAPDKISQVRNPLDPDSVNIKIAPPPEPEKKPVVSLKTGPKFPDPTSAPSMSNVSALDSLGKKKAKGQGKKSKAGLIIGGIILLFGLVAGLYFGVLRPQDIRREAAGVPGYCAVCAPLDECECLDGFYHDMRCSLTDQCGDQYHTWQPDTTCGTGSCGGEDPSVCDNAVIDYLDIIDNDPTTIKATNPSSNGCNLFYTIGTHICEGEIDTACNENNEFDSLHEQGNIGPGSSIQRTVNPAICTTVQIDIDTWKDDSLAEHKGGGGVIRASDVQGDACEPGQDILSCSSLTLVSPVGGTGPILATCIGEFFLAEPSGNNLADRAYFYFHYTNANTGALAGHEFVIGNSAGIGNTWSAKSQSVTLAEGSKYYGQCFVCNSVMQSCKPGSLYFPSGPNQSSNVSFPPNSQDACVQEVDLTTEPTIPPTIPPTVPPTIPPEALVCNSACSSLDFDPNAQECPAGLVCECPESQTCPITGGLCVNPICPDAPESANCVCPGSPVLACTNMDSTPAAPELGDTVTLTCSAKYYYSPIASPNLHFRFFLYREATPDNIYVINGESVSALPATTADNWTASLQSPALTDGGTYFASCQICDSQNYCNPASINTN